MDPQLVMSMFKELMEEQRKIAEKQQKDMLDMCSGTFLFDPDVDSCFSKWYLRYRAVFVEDAKQRPESARVRLLCKKLDVASFEKYQRHVLPKEVSEIGFDETVNTLKQVFDVKTSEFTPDTIDKDGRRPNPEKIQVIKSMAEPKNVAQLRAFLGMVTYYSSFVPTIKELRGPLDALMKKDVKWEWKSQQVKALEKLKAALHGEMNLAHYDPKQKIKSQ
ncbi:unnamed protein product [Heligmosomoides polygyrus]|uniref:Reverse transcriptase domain-containing protein n=1 Tax=Heligmosomoides polygyrus TaxID=6339 RepID=A0A183G304_HELPZ|nr:unnamed protein product [Heligmosomoides polygyrus]